ncbi:hypothetical protein, partial [Cellulomonas sp. KH9]|uniref:hypothetical protein n=1 Tax=Cellulomonas sp. KH9 TaxID=1855324 RepID=UPI001C4318E4
MIISIPGFAAGSTVILAEWAWALPILQRGCQQTRMSQPCERRPGVMSGDGLVREASTVSPDHHSDCQSLGGFNRSSQHLEIVEVFDGSSAAGSGPGRAPEV